MGLFCEKPASVVSSFLEVIREVLIFTKKTYKMAKLFVYGVNARCPRDILEGEFARCGEVTDVYITEKGYAFVTMADDDSADAAVKELNGLLHEISLCTTPANPYFSHHDLDVVIFV